MTRLTSKHRNVFGLVDARALDSQQVPYPYQEHHPMRALQMHSAFVHRLHRERQLEGHQGCVNALAWNSSGSLLLSGSDDTRVNVWDYDTRKLLHSIDTGHSANIFCTKFLPEMNDDLVVSGAGDSEVRMHSVSLTASRGIMEPLALFRCHAKRVKKLAVEDGNPHVIWSASEDGTLRQHDLRQSATCGPSDQECRNILLDLRNGVKRSLSDPPKGCVALKTCAINPTRPHQLLVGGSDAFARLYDRRMLPPLTSSQLLSNPPPCVCYYCPMHLSEHMRSSLHLTHVTFSPDGREVLLSYSGEHVYLMDSYDGRNHALVYNTSDIPKRTALVVEPKRNGFQHTESIDTGRVSFQECMELLEEARRAFEEGNAFCAIEAASEVIEASGSLLAVRLRHDSLCIRAAAFLKRGWKNDMHMAVRDSNEARLIDPTSVTAHRRMAEALSQLGRHKEALDFSVLASNLDPNRDDALVTQLKTKLAAAEEAKNNRNSEGEQKTHKRTSRIRSLREFFFRPDYDQSDSSDESRRAERDDSDVEDDVEMEMEIEMSVTDDNEVDREAGAPSGSSLNLRVRKKSDSGREKRASSATSATSCSAAHTTSEMAMDMRQRYVGHCNTGTDIKQASFLGERGEFVASGSDDGRWFIWEKKTGKLVSMLNGDENVVNCIQCHPYDCAIATSGIDSTIKLWTPCSDGEELRTPESDSLRVMVENQQQMRRHREIGFLLIAEAWSIFARRFEFMQENALRTASAH